MQDQVSEKLKSESALLDFLEISPAELKKIWWYRESMYRKFSIARENGGQRAIFAPDKRLKFLQQRILLLLNPLYRVRNSVHGFVFNKSVKSNALSHLRKSFVVNLDIEDFFSSVTERRIIGLLKSIGLEARVSEIIARICCNNSALPQGSPTSPILSNMICFRLDRVLHRISKDAHCIYTRYADDITFSSWQPPTSLFEGSLPTTGKFSPELLAPRLRLIFSTNGFKINARKAHFADKNSRRVVTGLKVNEIVNVDRRFVRNIRATLYSIENLGEAAAQEKFESDLGGSCQLRAHLKGEISWLRFIKGQSDPVVRSLALRFNRLFPTQKIETTPTAEEVRDRSVWVVEHWDGKMFQGTAFFLEDVGLVTAAHCVESAEEIEVYHPRKPFQKFSVKVSKIDVERDFAILDHSISTNEYFELIRCEEEVEVGDRVFALGFPEYSVGDELNVREGTVSSRTVKSGLRMIELTQKLSPGMSGGPIVSENNSVVGIAHRGGPEEPRDFAIRTNQLDFG